MRKLCTISIVCVACFMCISFAFKKNQGTYATQYTDKLSVFAAHQQVLIKLIEQSDLRSFAAKEGIKERINEARVDLKSVDFWLRYLDAVTYKKINGPLPVEWETDPAARGKQPSRREGAGLTLADLYLDKKIVDKKKLLQLIQSSVDACKIFGSDSLTAQLQTYNHFFYCNRLFLLNLASIYTTGFECPDTARVIPELVVLLETTGDTYTSFNHDFPGTNLSDSYLALYKKMLEFVKMQSSAYSQFDHFSFIRDYVNPLFILNQGFIKQFRAGSSNPIDYTLNSDNTSIFNKSLYNGQDPKGIFAAVTDTTALNEIDHIGKLLFYDPILSENNLRSCNSCHKTREYFTDTSVTTSLQFNGKDHLSRNSPTLLNVQFNQLIMMDGRHSSLQNQLKDVMTNPSEMGSNEGEVLKKVLSCREYKDAFTRLLRYTPDQPKISIEHITSSITFYYSKFSKFYAPFDDAMNEQKNIGMKAELGFNLFMSKAQCATCHFVPQFNGVKPPFTGSEFEVLGVPADQNYSRVSDDAGRYLVNGAPETLHAMRTVTVRNAEHTKPYMHNGVFSSLSEVIDFYNTGGGNGHKFKLLNQTLSSDSLHLTIVEKASLLAFIHSLSEDIKFELPPAKLPVSDMAVLNKRKVGGIK